MPLPNRRSTKQSTASNLRFDAQSTIPNLRHGGEKSTFNQLDIAATDGRTPA
jgi:hypothetical protein